VQTFLPYCNFEESAKSLDKKRCWKQVIEAKQIIECIIDENSKSRRFINHPAIQMWIGYGELLKHYYNIFLKQCLDFHHINTKLEFISNIYSWYEYDGHNLHFYLEKWKNIISIIDGICFPWWLGNENFHRSHRSRLLEKNYEFYIEKFSSEDIKFNDGKYWWPDMKNKKFKII